MEETLSGTQEDKPFGRKFIVFESELLKLFKQCPVCSMACIPSVKQLIGTMVTITCECINGHRQSWNSQPCSGAMPWGNLLCAAGILLTGSNPSRAINFLKQTGIASISIRTYNLMQRLYLVPSVISVWERHQQSLFQELKGKELVLGGDARCDSPGHSAKYGTYHLVELTSRKVVCMELVQVCTNSLTIN